MKHIVLTVIAFVGMYAFLRNNVGRLPDQIIFNTHPDIFYKMFIPLLMIVSAITAHIKKEQNSYFYLSVFAMLIDAINRIAVVVNHYYLYLTYGLLQPHIDSENTIVVTNSLVPSHVMLFVEIILIIYILTHITVYMGKIEKQAHNQSLYPTARVWRPTLPVSSTFYKIKLYEKKSTCLYILLIVLLL